MVDFVLQADREQAFELPGELLALRSSAVTSTRRAVHGFIKARHGQAAFIVFAQVGVQHRDLGLINTVGSLWSSDKSITSRR